MFFFGGEGRRSKKNRNISLVKNKRKKAVKAFRYLPSIILLQRHNKNNRFFWSQQVLFEIMFV